MAERPLKIDPGIIYGLNPVLALLENSSREVDSLTVLKGGRGPRIQDAIRLARERGIRPHFVERALLDRMTGGAVHQGVTARAGVRRQPTWDEILDRVEREADLQLILLDGVEDPQNLGAVIRSAEAFGAMAVVLPKDRTAPLSAAAVKASAGAGERVDVIRVTNLSRTIEALQKSRVQIVGLDANGGSPLAETDLTGRVALVIGGEGKGLRRLTREKCDRLATIPIIGGVASLNLSVATGIALYEAGRQRGRGRIGYPS